MSVAEMIEIERQRDVLPLPTGTVLAELLEPSSQALLSPSQRRRRRARRGENVWLERGVGALNLMYQGVGHKDEHGKETTAAQRSAVRELGRAYGSLPVVPADLDPKRAYQALLGSGVGYTDDTGIAGEIAIYRRGAVSLPRCRAGSVSLYDALPADMQKNLVDERGLLCSAAATQEAFG